MIRGFRIKLKRFLPPIITAPKIGLGLLVASTFGCGREQDKTASIPSPIAETTVVTVETNIIDGIVVAKPPVVFTDTTKQTRFEKLYQDMNDHFAPPVPGTLIRIQKTNGGRIEGQFQRYTIDGIAISTPDGPVIIDRKTMTDMTQETIFSDTFRRNFAEKLVINEAEAGRTSSLDDLYFNAVKATVIENRRITAEYMPGRLGPGRYFATNGVVHFRGETVHVVHETNGWICVKKNSRAEHNAGWIPKFSSFMTNYDNKDVVAREVEKLIESGFLIDIDPKKNEALVDLYEWRIADSSVIEGKSRMLAIYCGQQKNSKLFWVDIKDALSGRKLAEFSVSKGFKTY